MRLFVEETYHDYGSNQDKACYVHNPKVDYVCFCECGGYGTRSQYGRDDYCPKCGKWLNWCKEESWK